MDTMDFDPDQRRRALQHFMGATGLKVAPWEEAAELGEGTLRKFLAAKGSNTLTDRTYSLLASGASKLLGRAIIPSELQEIRQLPVIGEQSTDLNVKLEEPQHLVPAPSLPERDQSGQIIEILGTALAGREGDFQVTNGERIDKVPRPANLRDRAGLLGLWVEGDSMRPWRRAGQLVVLDGLRRPRSDDHVVVELRATPPDEDRPAFLKLLVRQTATKLILAQYRPAKEFEIDLRRVHKIYRVMEYEELMGV